MARAILIAVLLTFIGCGNQPPPVAPAPPAQHENNAADDEVSRMPAPPPLTIDALMNAEYKPLDWASDGVPPPPELVELDDGQGFESVETDDRMSDGRPFYYRYYIRVSTAFESSTLDPADTSFAFGDLNGDGIDEAVVALVANGGMGNRESLYLAVVANENGRPRHVASSVNLGDARSGNADPPQIVDGAIHYTKRAYADADAHCCPSLLETRVFRLAEGDTLAEDEREDIGADDWR